jgi:multidrug resistance efflux pump
MSDLPTPVATVAAVKPSPPTPPAPAPPTWRPAPKRPIFIGLIVLLAVVVVLLILAAWGLPPFAGTVQKTENAYVRGRTTVIAPQVSGYVVEVLVKDYAQVNAGQVLVRIDDRIYSARVAQARANVAAQMAALANSEQAHASRAAGLQGQTAALANAQAQLLRAKADMARVEDLVRDGSVSIRERDQTLAARAQAEAQVHQAEATSEIARQDIRTVDVGKGGLEAQVEAARAQLKLAEIDLDNTTIRAPESGQIGEVGVRLGQYVTNGTQLLSLVPAERWVIANYKEAQTARIAPGQKAAVSVDALGGARLTGRVETLSPAAGSEFAVLKPDNATGNFVKVPQRIGVRIALDADQPLLLRLRPGMSVEARVDTRADAR